MGTVGDKYVLTLTTKAVNQDPIGINPMFNVFAYEATNGTPDANDLFSVFNSVIIPLLYTVLSEGTDLTNIDVINLDDAGDFDYNVIANQGIRTGEEMPMFVGWAFRYNRAVRGVHNGRKAFSVISETDQDAGQPAVGMIVSLNNLALGLGQVLTGANGDYTPRIWRRAGNYKVGGVSTPFPDTFYPISGVTFARESTQNSRKR